MNDLLLPPSCNWFQHNGVSSRIKDRLLATSCFKHIAIYQIPNEAGPPQVFSLIHHNPGKVNGVSFYPDSSHQEFGNTIAVIGDQFTLSLINIHKRNFLAQHVIGKFNLQSLCWGLLSGEDVVVVVGDRGHVAIWQPKYLVVRVFTLEVKKDLTIVEVMPHDQGQALVACAETILLISLKGGEILSQFKGHENSIYCIRWYLGKESPLNTKSSPVNDRWKEIENDRKGKQSAELSKGMENSLGPYFVTSDYGRNILLWDVSMKRYIWKATVPLCNAGAQKRNGKERNNAKNFHIALNWVNNELYSSTTKGEVILWTLSSDAKYKLMYHSHSRAIYNMAVINNIIVTISQDRIIQAYDVSASKSFFQMPSIGVCACSMSFCPHDASRLAIGMQDGVIKLLSLGDCSNLKAQNIQQTIKGKVLSLSWHPNQEGKLLFGTVDGQVGIADINTSKVSTFAYFHQKAAYKVEWAPPFSPNKTNLSDSWCAYSFGGRDIVIHSPSNLMADPVRLSSFIDIENKGSNKFAVSEFAFSPDYRYLAIGSLDGIVKIYDRITLDCKVVISQVRKTILHLLWKPPSTCVMPYVLAVSSGEVNVYIFDLEKCLNEESDSSEPVTFTNPGRELSAHTARIVWMSWSPHADGLFATASYDHTVQIWNVNTGEPLHNYGGHTHRVFRVEFSPLEPDLVYSFAEENCIHKWRISLLTCRTPSESAAAKKSCRPKRSKNSNEATEENAKTKENENKKSDLSGSVDSCNSFNGSCSSSVKIGGGNIQAHVGSNLTKKPPKSFFPLFHNYSTRKRSFHHICILSLMEAHFSMTNIITKSSQAKNVQEADVDIEDDLLEEGDASKLMNTDEDGYDKKLNKENMRFYVEQALQKYNCYMPSDHIVPDVEDVCSYLSYFGCLSEVDAVINKEISNHESKDSVSHANLMHCWQGSLEPQIKWAAKHKHLDAFLVAAAPQVSFSLWEYACEAYAEQLTESNEPVTAATYLLLIHKDEEAINLLMKHKHFHEALTIAKYRMGFNIEAINNVINTWTDVAVFEGNFELVALLQLSIGNVENAARTLARRTETGSLIVASQLFAAAQCPALANSTSVLALKESSLKNDFDRLKIILGQTPSLKWYKCISECHECLLNYIEPQNQIALLPSSSSEFHPVQENSTVSDELDNLSIDNSSPLKEILQRWKNAEIILSEFGEFSQKIKENFATKKLPSSVKQLWFFISTSISEMLLDGLSENSLNTEWESHLETILKYVEFWGKNNQIFYLTHLLLAKGCEDLSTFEIKISGSENSSIIKKLRHLYVTSEVFEILKYLQDDSSYIPWENNGFGRVGECFTEESSKANSQSLVNSDNIINENNTNTDFSSCSNGISDRYPEISINEDVEQILEENVSLHVEKLVMVSSKSSLQSFSFCTKKEFIKALERFIYTVSSYSSILDEGEEISSQSAIEDGRKAVSQIVAKLSERNAISESESKELQEKWKIS